jgi:hypothetical protein
LKVEGVVIVAMKKKNRQQSNAAMAAGNDILAASFDDLGVDVLANILAFLKLEVIMHLRRVSKKFSEAAKMAIVPPTNFTINSAKKYNAMLVMTTELPNLQQITLCGFTEGLFGGGGGQRHKYSDGEDPNEEEVATTSHYTTHDIGIISNFSKLRKLAIADSASLNGRYPVIFNFPLLQKLSIHYSKVSNLGSGNVSWTTHAQRTRLLEK